MTLAQKMKLYDGQSVEGFKEQDIKEVRKDTQREGLHGISPRSMVNIISETLIDEEIPNKSFCNTLKHSYLASIKPISKSLCRR